MKKRTHEYIWSAVVIVITTALFYPIIKYGLDFMADHPRYNPYYDIYFMLGIIAMVIGYIILIEIVGSAIGKLIRATIYKNRVWEEDD